MRFLLEKFVRKRLGPFDQLVNLVDQNQPMRLNRTRKVAVIGGGIAGISAAAVLAERAFEVDLFERNNFLGGKAGSWKMEFSDGFTTNIEHGFHAFFRQYYNLRRILGKVNALKNLKPIPDYMILTRKYGNFSFRGVDPLPLANLLSLRRTGVYHLRDFLRGMNIEKMMALLQFDRLPTFEIFDAMSFSEYADAAVLPPPMRLMFTTFSRAFFAEPQYISMAELIKSFHFYFLSNDHGLIYDVLDDDFQTSLWDPVVKYLHGLGCILNLDTAVNGIRRERDKWLVRGKKFDHIILATDIPGTRKIVEGSVSLQKNHSEFCGQIREQKTSQKYAVLRIWTDRDLDGDYPFFMFTDALEILDSITIYHRMEESSRHWTEKNGGGIYELHSYALPAGIDDPAEIRDHFLKEFEVYFPEMRGMKIIYENLQVRDDFTAFHTGLYRNRPGCNTGIKGLYLAGDWIRLPIPAMLMEAAASSAIYAVNEILKTERLQLEPVYSVPLKGIFA